MQKDEFFIIESDNLEKTKTKLYGYTIIENNIYNHEVPENKLTGNGTYLNITNNDDNITITQDNNGSYGLYIYKEEDKYTISNSLTKLIKHIKEKHSLTLNKEYADTFLTTKQNISFDETIIKEITQIPKDYKLIINKNNKKISYQKTNIQENTISTYTTEAIQCIDKWFNQWINIIRNICQQKNNIIINIDETISSRIILSLILNSNINPQNIQITSIDPNSKIITELSKLTNLPIKKSQREIIKDIQKSIEKSYNTKLTLNSQINLQNNTEHEEYIINNTNPYSNYDNKTLNELIDTYSKKAKYYSKTFGKNIENFSWRNIHKLQKHLKEYDIYSDEFHKLLYTHTTLRNNLKENIEQYLSNKITLNPLLDVSLLKIKSKNKQELYTTILQRYSPELLGISFIDEHIDEKTLNNAIKINEKHPLKKQEYPIIGFVPKYEYGTNMEEYSPEYEELIRKIFFSNSFKHTFLKYYSNHTYNQIVKKYTEYDQYDTNELSPAIAIINTIEDIEYSQKNKIHTEYDWLRKFVTQETPKQDKILTNSLLNKYNTARIDIKNEGSPSNQVKIYDISDESSKIFMPGWFTNDKGVGIYLTSDKSEISFKIKCINKGSLKFDLRTLDIRDRTNKRFPVYIDYLSFKIDNQEILTENQLIWHDKPIHFRKNVQNNEILHITIKWRPFTNKSKYN